MIDDRAFEEKAASVEVDKLQKQLFRYAEDLQNLVQMQKALESLLGVVADGYLVTDLRGEILGADRNGQALLGLTGVDSGSAGNIADHIDAAGQGEFSALLQLLDRSAGGPVDLDAHLSRSLDDNARWDCDLSSARGNRSVVAHVWRIDSLNNQPALAWVFKDKTSGEALENANRMALSVYRNTRDAIMMTDIDGKIVSVNPAFTRITGWQEQDVLGKNPRILSSGRQDANFYRSFWMTLKTFGLWRGEIWNKRRNGDIYREWLSVSTARDAEGNAQGYISVFTDMSGHTDGQQDNRDGITGLFNRQGIRKEIDSLIALARGQSASLETSLVTISIESFDAFNREHGHGKTEALLVAVTRKLEMLLPKNSLVARLEEGVFCAAWTDPDADAYADHVVDRLKSGFRDPIALGVEHFPVTLHFGFASYPRDGLDAEALIGFALGTAL